MNRISIKKTPLTARVSNRQHDFDFIYDSAPRFKGYNLNDLNEVY